jgi:transcriptional regulator with XRE-family HTH domain|tara:strand:+ start:1397 stop:1672 length:276 start_codon:yes stop_codon:yes gene_type:complete
MSDITEAEPFIIDTNPALQALFNQLGESYREVGRVLGVSHTHLWHALKGQRNPISVNLLAKYAQEARKNAGVSMTILITPEGVLKYKIDRD